MKQNEKFLTAYTELLIEKIKSFEGNWEKPWVNAEIGLPKNLKTNKVYKGYNLFYLSIITDIKRFSYPCFLTFIQAKDLGISILKNSKGFIINKFEPKYYNSEEKKSITDKQYNELTDEEQKKYIFSPLVTYHTVFNIDQTNIKDVKPELFKQIELSYKNEKEEREVKGHYELDNLIKYQNWVCPIKIKISNSAFYAPLNDEIVVPKQNQFLEDSGFYSTLLHEMAHSTGHKSRLDRLKTGKEEYAKEELVAELSASYSGIQLGVSIIPRKDNIAYLKSWLNSLQKDPEYLNEILISVSKATDLIFDTIIESELKIYSLETV